MVLGFLQKDPAIRTLVLLEGRRIRGDGHMVVLVPGFIEFVKMLDGILKELAAQGELAPNIHPQVFRSALMEQSRVCYETRCSHARPASPRPTLRRTCVLWSPVSFPVS
jgi:hypothetical protein